MPYNTRRKSLSLPSLGIHIPVTHAERAAAAAAAAAAASRQESRSRSSNISGSNVSAVDNFESHPSKKLKRSYGGDESSRTRPGPSLPTSPRNDTTAERPLKYDPTPPPSPKCDQITESSHEDDEDIVRPTVDLEGINDDIVEAVIAQLQDRHNQPHLVKELAAALSQKLSSVQHSANPCAIISSRLSTYLKRSCWSAIAPCPLAKELETVHPRRTYFYLTTYPRKPLPDNLPVHIPQRTIISPSISSAASRSDDSEAGRRREISPSPEVDLSSPELDDGDDDIAMPSTPIGSVSAGPHFVRHHRSASPPLEKDEREFTQTADGLQKRKLSSELLLSELSEQAMDIDDVSREDLWFGDTKSLAASSIVAPMSFISSPAIRPSFPGSSGKKDAESESWLRAGKLLEWDMSPETIELEELDCLLDGC